MKKKGLSARTGDFIPYVICLTVDDKSESDKSASDRAFHPDEINNSDLRIGKIYNCSFYSFLFLLLDYIFMDFTLFIRL